MEHDGREEIKKIATAPRKQKEEEPLEIDKKRVLIAIVLGGFVATGIFVWMKNNPARIADMHVQKSSSSSGEVAGATSSRISLSEKQEELQKQIDQIKENVTKLKLEDVKDQEVAKKILGDLDGVLKQASESAKVLDVKGNLCEEVKRRFCE